MDSLLAVGGVIFLYLNFLFVVLAVALYLLQALGLYGMADKAGVTPRWVAFIPIVNAYVWGKIIKEIRISNYVLTHPEIVLPVAPFIYGLLYDINILGPLLLLCFLVLYAAGYYCLYSLYRPDNAAIYTIISIVFPFVMPFFFYSLRNEAPISCSVDESPKSGSETASASEEGSPASKEKE